MTDIEERVREAFARTAAPVVPAPDPLGRLLARRRRRRAWRLTTLAAVLALAFGGGGVVVAGGPGLLGIGPEPGVIGGGEIRSEWSRRLIASPVRGSLAADAALVGAVTAAFRAHARGRGEPGHTGISSDLDRTKVLFLHQIGQERQAVVAFYNDTHAALMSVVAPADVTPEDLVRGPNNNSTGAGIEPFVILDGPADDSLVALAPAGCEIAVSPSVVVDPAGVARREWEAVGDWTVRPAGARQDWWQVTCDGAVRYRQPLSRYAQVEPDPAAAATVDRGTADPTAVRRALAATRLSGCGQPCTAEPVWGGVPPGQSEPVVVVGGPAPGGGVAALALTGDGGFPNFADGPDSGRILGPPEADVDASFTTGTGSSLQLIAVRLPDATGATGDRLLIVAPPGADEVRAGAQSVPVVDAVAVVTGQRPLNIEIQALGDGAVLETMRYVEPGAGPVRYGVELIDTW